MRRRRAHSWPHARVDAAAGENDPRPRTSDRFYRLAIGRSRSTTCRVRNRVPLADLGRLDVSFGAGHSSSSTQGRTVRRTHLVARGFLSQKLLAPLVPIIYK